MDDTSSHFGCIRFQLFGIPIVIRPVSWVLLAFLGGAFGVKSGEDLSGVLLFVVAGMLCLLVHEMGHALTGRQLTGCQPNIEIGGLGGFTYCPLIPGTRLGYFLFVLAGPLGSLALGLVAGLVFGLQIGNVPAGVVFSLIAPFTEPPASVLSAVIPGMVKSGLLPQEGVSTLFVFYGQLFTVCVWWTVFNLLPIFPLDGGRLLGTVLGNDRMAAMVGVVLGVLLCILCLVWSVAGGGSWWNVFLAGWLTYMNVIYLRAPGS